VNIRAGCSVRPAQPGDAAQVAALLAEPGYPDNRTEDLPSGKTDKGESVTAAAARELKEETGLTVDPASLRVAGIIHGWGIEAPNGFLTVIFAARAWDGEPVNTEPRKHAQVAWFPVDRVPADLVPDRREALLGYLRSPSEPVVSTEGF
jgi:8-oxo-dGTP pyrophosphatase MutT (NUDIX family)